MYWYRVDIDHIDKLHSVMGCSELAPAEFSMALQGENFVCLKRLIYRDSQRRVQSWSEWDAFVKDEIWLNPKRVVSFQELALKPEME